MIVLLKNWHIPNNTACFGKWLCVTNFGTIHWDFLNQIKKSALAIRLLEQFTFSKYDSW
jgi:hypothetical protein